MSTMETYRGHVRTPADAIILFEACRTGHLPRVQRRLSEKERQQIKSGSVFVWDEREAGMRRWTDGKSWSASRVSGSFLTYREMEGKRGGNGFSAPVQKKSNGSRSENGSGKGDSDEDGPDGYRYKPDGLMKQSFSITTHTGQHLHLISYYSRASHGSHGLMQPSMDPNLRTIRPAKGMYPESSVNEQSNVPAVTRAPMPGSPFTTAPNPIGSPYARSGPPHPQHYVHAPPPSHVWPPTPMGTPPTAYSPYYPGGPPPPGYFIQPGHSPHYPHHYPPHGYAAPTYLDRPPPQLNNSGLPPPPPMANGHPYPPQYLPPAQHAPSMSPRVQQASHVGPPQAAPGLPPHPYAQLDPAVVPNHHHLTAPNQPQHQAPSPHQHQTSTPGPQLPQINGMGQAPPPPTNGLAKPPTPPASNASAATTTEAATLPRPTSTEAHRNPETNHNAPSAKTFPSIHALVNGTDDSNHSRHDINSSRQGSRSPKNQLQHATESRPGSDNKALRTLDKAFMV